MSTISQEPPLAKQNAAKAAADLVQSGMAVGLGSGTTAALVVRAISDRIAAEGLKIIGVPTSVATAELASALSIPLRQLDDIESLDINLDGADEVDSQFRMIKGRGGAFLREKIVASVARRRVTVITPEKQVTQLGLLAPIPVEISRIGPHHIERRIRDLGALTTLRANPDGSPYITDGGNLILDCHFQAGNDPALVDSLLKQTVGVFETGIFLNLCDLLIVGHENRVELLESHVR